MRRARSPRSWPPTCPRACCRWSTATADGRPAGREARTSTVVGHVGSTATGRAIALACAPRPAPSRARERRQGRAIVDAGVDPVWAAEQAALGAFANAGQICTSVERIYVHATVAEPSSPRWSPRPRAGRALGSGRWSTAASATRVHGARRAARSRRRRAARRRAPCPTARAPSTRRPCSPAARTTWRCMREETFGPVAPVRVVEPSTRRSPRAARPTYGLAATVLTPTCARPARRRELPVGTVKVNAVFGGAPGRRRDAPARQRAGLRLRPRTARRDDVRQGRALGGSAHVLGAVRQEDRGAGHEPARAAGDHWPHSRSWPAGHSGSTRSSSTRPAATRSRTRSPRVRWCST